MMMQRKQKMFLKGILGVQYSTKYIHLYKHIYVCLFCMYTTPGSKRINKIYFCLSAFFIKVTYFIPKIVPKIFNPLMIINALTCFKISLN